MRRTAALAALALATCAGGCLGDDEPGTGAGALPVDGRSPRAAAAEEIRVVVELQRPSLAERLAGEQVPPASQRAYVRSLEREVRALEGALTAKDVALGRVVRFGRAWSGFAATIDAEDLPELQALGLRAQPVRRFYGAVERSGRLVQAPPGEGGPPATPRGAPALALLDSGVDQRALRGRIVAGHDAVGGDRDPSPRGTRELHGTQMAGVLADELPPGQRVLSVRVAGLQDGEAGGLTEHGTTDQLLTGIERAVDPDGDGDVEDAVKVALVGVSSPYSGFAEAPEVEASAAARTLGTLIVAPAGNEGRGGGRFGTVGSPAAAPEVVAVGALEGDGLEVPSVRLGLATEHGRATLDGVLLAGDGRPRRAPLASLVGPSQADPAARGRALGGSPLEYFGVDAAPRAPQRVAVVPVRGARGSSPPLAARAAAAAAAGAAGLVVCEPDEDRPLPSIPAAASAGIPVVGLRGGGAERALELTRSGGGVVFVSRADRDASGGDPRSAPGSSHGPTYALAPKPDLSAPGTAEVPVRGRPTFVAGTSVAAARVAAAAASVRLRHPDYSPADAAAALVATSRPRGPVLAAGAGELNDFRAERTPITAAPYVVALPQQPSRARWTVTRTIEVRGRAGSGGGPGDAPGELRVFAESEDRGVRVKVRPARLPLRPDAPGRLELTVSSPGPRPPGYAAGRVRLRGGALDLVVPFGVAIGATPPPRLGELRLVSEGGRVEGVRFVAGAVERERGRTAVEPIATLELELVPAGAGGDSRVLTPPGGAPDLLPGEYGYTLAGDLRSGLTPGEYRFEVRARAAGGGPPLVRRSPVFTIGGATR